jgi:hypothetical protein
MSLKQFIEQENKMRAFFKETPLDADKLTQEDATKLFQRLDSNMSPEHLHADGERKPADARRLAKMYTQAFADLRAKGFAVPTQLYNMA